MNESKHDIITKEDIRQLVDVFYGKVVLDDVLKDFFSGLDFEHHKPKMIDFWSFVLLDEPGYTTSVFDKHAHMKLADEHFDRWISLFDETVHELFEGEKASMAVFRAKTIAWSFAEKFKRMNDSTL